MMLDSTLPDYDLAGYEGITRLEIHSEIYWQVTFWKTPGFALSAIDPALDRRTAFANLLRRKR